TAIDPALQRHQESNFRARQVVNPAQVDGETRVRVRLDQLVKPVALRELPIGHDVFARLASEDHYTASLVSCDAEGRERRAGPQRKRQRRLSGVGTDAASRLDQAEAANHIPDLLNCSYLAALLLDHAFDSPRSSAEIAPMRRAPRRERSAWRFAAGKLVGAG